MEPNGTRPKYEHNLIDIVMIDDKINAQKYDLK